MSEPIYLAIEHFNKEQDNPYWSPNNSKIESKTILVSVVKNTFFYSNDDLAEFMSHVPQSTAKNIKYYSIEEIKPRVKTTHTLSLKE